MPSDPIFDIRTSVRSRNIQYLFVMPLFSFGCILLGYWMIPETFVWELSEDMLQQLSVWSFFGLGFIATGIGHLIKMFFQVLKFKGTAGSWHFRLTNDELLWEVPKHTFGPETGFSSKLSNITEIEYRTTYEFEEDTTKEYWVHFVDQKPIQLMDYSGLTLSALVSKIEDSGVCYNETVIRK
ncbi:hypothetical protein [Parasulfitobacter algicola]|uniref:Uncharacterized protein n=1 Tax=Parasulfitobacter algicola TaxID=2614809 RepID=A0ABX2IUA8_9RHOB|nr:hypothetical protein [Sulfitobacter algicola]NSX56489.1 hypothetical protein [Sulfitobacter algicola]